MSLQHPSFLFDQYLIRRQVLALTGVLRILNPQGDLVLFCHQKMLKLKEDIRIFSDESRLVELLHIQARQVIDFSAQYDVYDRTSGIMVGSLRRGGLRSMARDTWQALDPSGTPFGILQEDSLKLALLRRVLAGGLVPQNFDLMIGSERVADLRQRFNLFRYELELDFRMDPNRRLDRRLGLAAGILLAIVEGRQE